MSFQVLTETSLVHPSPASSVLVLLCVRRVLWSILVISAYVVVASAKLLLPGRVLAIGGSILVVAAVRLICRVFVLCDLQARFLHLILMLGSADM